MKTINAFIFITLLPVVLFGQVGKDFPLIEGQTVEGITISLPKAVKGKYALIGLASSLAAQEDLNTWLQPMYDNFIRKAEKGQLFDDSYDVFTYFVSIINGANKAASGSIKKRFKEQADKELLPLAIFYEGDLKPLKEYLSIKNTETVYFYLLDANGKIVHVVYGKYSTAKMEDIEKLLDN